MYLNCLAQLTKGPELRNSAQKGGKAEGEMPRGFFKIHLGFYLTLKKVFFSVFIAVNIVYKLLKGGCYYLNHVILIQICARIFWINLCFHNLCKMHYLFPNEIIRKLWWVSYITELLSFKKVNRITYRWNWVNLYISI